MHFVYGLSNSFQVCTLNSVSSNLRLKVNEPKGKKTPRTYFRFFHGWIYFTGLVGYFFGWLANVSAQQSVCIICITIQTCILLMHILHMQFGMHAQANVCWPAWRVLTCKPSTNGVCVLKYDSFRYLVQSILDLDLKDSRTQDVYRAVLAMVGRQTQYRRGPLLCIISDVGTF